MQLQPERNSMVILGTVRVQYGHAAKPGAELLPVGAATPEPDPPLRHPAPPPAASLPLHLLSPCRRAFLLRQIHPPHPAVGACIDEETGSLPAPAFVSNASMQWNGVVSARGSSTTPGAITATAAPTAITATAPTLPAITAIATIGTLRVTVTRGLAKTTAARCGTTCLRGEPHQLLLSVPAVGYHSLPRLEERWLEVRMCA